VAWRARSLDIGASECINRATGAPELIIHPLTRLQSIRNTMKSLAPSQRSLQSPWHRLLLMSARTSGRAHVTVQHQKQTSLTEITIKTTSALFGYACSKSLSSDRFADFSVTADLDPVVLKLSPSGLTPTVFKRTPNTQEVSSA
jgi:hypothetical protein